MVARQMVTDDSKVQWKNEAVNVSESLGTGE